MISSGSYRLACLQLRYTQVRRCVFVWVLLWEICMPITRVCAESLKEISPPIVLWYLAPSKASLSVGAGWVLPWFLRRRKSLLFFFSRCHNIRSQRGHQFSGFKQSLGTWQHSARTSKTWWYNFCFSSDTVVQSPYWIRVCPSISQAQQYHTYSEIKW